MKATTEVTESAVKTLTEDGTVLVPRVSIDWNRTTPWWRLLSQTLSISWRASHLLVAGLAIAITYYGWLLASMLFQPTLNAPIPFSKVAHGELKDGIFTLWSYVEPIYNEIAAPISLRSSAYIVFGLLWTIGVWAFAGGVLARRSLMEMGVRTSVGWIPSCQLVCKRWLSMVWAITMPLVAVVCLACLPILVGFIGRFGNFGLTVSLGLMIPSTLLVFAIGWPSIISLLGFPLSVCAIVGEKKADAFDGLSRSAAYMFQRPMTLLVIFVIATSLVAMGDYLVHTVLQIGEAVLWRAYSFGLGKEIEPTVGNSPLLQHFLVLAKSILVGIQAGFLFSFFWSASAGAYLTLRYEIDHTNFDELDLNEIGAPIPMPTVKNDGRGVAEVTSESGEKNESNTDDQ
jgi:hypothetical protein